MVGCVIASGGEIIAEGWHQRCGGPHAEVVALEAAGRRAVGATLVVTLEPCCHFGKTPPCTAAVVKAGIRRVVVAMPDPFPAVGGQGLAELEKAGIEVSVGVMEQDARRLNAPYLKLIGTGRPWLVAKWAMTLDGKINTSTGESRWISGEAARQVVHRLRGRMDGILVGSGTAAADDPLLTARPTGLRVPTRIVLDSQAMLSPDSQLARTARETPVLVGVSAAAPAENCARLAAAGCEVLTLAGGQPNERLLALLDEMGRRRMTNVLVEGGNRLLGSLVDTGQIDEVHVFLAPRIVGGTAALSPIGGLGIGSLAKALKLDEMQSEQCGPDLHIHGRIARD
jgi:diaminohydroxyphosphoribosylaminopyrimidine deaminase/5-amino-6-(5-phosphoribosylamino)uracil reductase